MTQTTPITGSRVLSVRSPLPTNDEGKQPTPPTTQPHTSCSLTTRLLRLLKPLALALAIVTLAPLAQAKQPGGMLASAVVSQSLASPETTTEPTPSSIPPMAVKLDPKTGEPYMVGDVVGAKWMTGTVCWKEEGLYGLAFAMASAPLQVKTYYSYMARGVNGCADGGQAGLPPVTGILVELLGQVEGASGDGHVYNMWSAKEVGGSLFWTMIKAKGRRPEVPIFLHTGDML